MKKYDDPKIIKTYKDILENQTLDHVLKMKKKFQKPNILVKVWDLVIFLNSIIDESDPDNSLPQIYHCFQTAEAIKKKLKTRCLIKDIFGEEFNILPYKIKSRYPNYLDELYNFQNYEWLIVVGFIHDLGKYLIKHNLPQWSVVGDTFPVGCKLSKNYVLHQFYENNIDYNKFKNKCIYENHCGLSNVHMSYGHDEFLANVLENNKTNIPKEGIYLIKFHSFYCWHTSGKVQRPYEYLANDFDWYMLPLLKFFQNCDLYSKTKNITSFETIEKKYKFLIEKYIGESIYI